MEVGPGVKDYKPGDKVVAMLNHRVSYRFHILFCQLLFILIYSLSCSYIDILIIIIKQIIH